MDDLQSSGNLIDEVYKEILTRLNHQPNLIPEKLSVSGFAKELNVSRTPVNMALMRLESEGLVRRSPDGGFYMNPVSLEDIEEIFELKEMLGPLFMSKAARCISAEEIEAIFAVVGQMEQAAQSNNRELWFEADIRFHDILFTVMDNRRYQRIWGQLNSQFYKLKVGQMILGNRMIVSTEQHRMIAQALSEHDEAKAAAVTLEHIRSLKESVINLVSNVIAPIWGDPLQRQK